MKLDKQDIYDKNKLLLHCKKVSERSEASTNNWKILYILKPTKIDHIQFLLVSCSALLQAHIHSC